MNIHELREMYKDKEFIPYIELLKADEWKQKRGEIIKRDGYNCTNCGKQETNEHYDPGTNKSISFWFGEDRYVKGLDEPIPDIIAADKPYHLEVHHHFYVINRLPWEYDDVELTTFCNWCHWDFHKNNIVKVYSEDMLNELKYTPCHRCYGAGWFPEFKHVQGGSCFRCNGARFEELIGRG